MVERSSVRWKLRDRGPRVLPVPWVCCGIHQLWQGEDTGSGTFGKEWLLMQRCLLILRILFAASRVSYTFHLLLPSQTRFSSESVLEDSKGLQKRQGWADHDEGSLDNLQQGSLELFPSRRVSVLLRWNPGRSISPWRGHCLRHFHDSHVSVSHNTVASRAI